MVFILNEEYYSIAEYNLALSDYFVKSLDNIQEKVITGELTFNKQPLTRSDASKPGNMLSAQTVYAGPASSNYATVGSVSSGEMVYLLGQQAGWYHIQYMVTGTSQQKSGFVPVSTVNNNGHSVHEEQMTGGQNFANATVNIMSCDDTDIDVSLGTVYAGEGMTVLYTYGYSDANKSYNIAYVEISTPSGTKRGYIPSSYLAGINYPSSVARITDTNSAYSGPDSSYVKLGGAYYNEFVTILAKDTGNNWVWVEYNTPDGRKRGFMDYAKMVNYNHPGMYNDLPVFNNLKQATQQLTVYGGPSTNAANIGLIYNQEVVSQLNSERGFAYIEYNTTGGAKRGYVVESSLIGANPPSIPTINKYNFEEGTYGTSGLGKDLKYYKLGNGPNVAFAVFEQHGWEDAWAYDGIELIKIAQDVIQNLSTNGISSNWTLFIIPYANPDGVTNGYTNNGPGRCTVTTKIDMNRCWPAQFRAYYTSRNYTGDYALGAPEAQVLKKFIEDHQGNGNKIILDIHGWLNQTYGDVQVASYFTNQFGFGHSSTYGNGYLETWGKTIGAQSCLVELPMPSSSASIITNNYAGKVSNAIRNMLNDIGGSQTPIEGGEDVNEEVIVISDGDLNLREGPSTSYPIIASITQASVITRIKKGVITADGYTWDKVMLSNGVEGYVNTNYIKLNNYSDGQYNYVLGDWQKINPEPTAEENYRYQERIAGQGMGNTDEAEETQRQAILMAATLYLAGAKDAGNNLLFFVTYGRQCYEDRMGLVMSYVSEEEGFTQGHKRKEIFFNEAIRDVSGARDVLYDASNRMMGATEKILEDLPDGTYSISCLNEITGSTNFLNINWYGAMNFYRSQNRAIVTVSNNNLFWTRINPIM